MSYITVPVNKILFGARAVALSWWNWEAYERTWQILDQNPDVPTTALPMYRIQFRVLRDFRKAKGNINMLAEKGVNQYRQLYFSIKNKGYVPELSAEKPITVNISGNGLLTAVNGHHRISILRHLGYESVRVKVNQRSHSWLNFKQRMRRLYRQNKLYQPLDHPDFAGWHVAMDCADTLNTILNEAGSLENKKVLDVGCCTGWYCYRLVERGASVLGIDRDAVRIEAADRLRGWYGFQAANPVFVCDRLEHALPKLKMEKPRWRRVHAVLFLNVFHHILHDDGLFRAKQKARLISGFSDHVYLETSRSGLAKAGVTPEQMTALFCEAGDYDVKKLETAYDHKLLYHFSRCRA